MERIEIPPISAEVNRGGGPLLLSAVQSRMTLIAKNGTGLAKGGLKGLMYEESLVSYSAIDRDCGMTERVGYDAVD